MLGAVKNNQFDRGITVSWSKARRVEKFREKVANSES